VTVVVDGGEISGIKVLDGAVCNNSVGGVYFLLLLRLENEYF
jgi:hypothetical protein